VLEESGEVLDIRRGSMRCAVMQRPGGVALCGKLVLFANGQRNTHSRGRCTHSIVQEQVVSADKVEELSSGAVRR
jgi:hypothetical protein